MNLLFNEKDKGHLTTSARFEENIALVGILAAHSMGTPDGERPDGYIGYLSFMENSVWPYPPVFTGEWYARLRIMSDFRTGLWNSLLLGVGTALLSALFATTAAIGVLRCPVRRRGLMIAVYLAPLFVAQVLIGIATLMFNAHRVGDALRHGIEPELHALATIVNLLVFALLFVIYLLIRLGALRLGVPED